MRLINCLLFLLLITSNLYADHGIYFRSNEVSKENRTGIDITHENNISYTKEFTIHFKISFRNSDTHYGNILSLKESVNNNLIQVNFRSPDLYVIHNKSETLFRLNLEELKISDNRWVDFELHVDAINQEINLKFGNESLKSPIQFTRKSDFALSLGVVNNYGSFIDEVPSISIKDIQIRIDGSPKHFWPLKKTEKVNVKDDLSSRTAKLYHPNWVIDYHKTWEKVNTFKFESVPLIAYNKQKETIDFVLMNGKLFSYDLKTKELSEQTNSIGYPSFESAQQIIYDKNNTLTSYSFNKNKISTYKPKKKQWSRNQECTINDVPKYWHHNKLINPVSNQITTLCGYGYYSYYNLIQSFDAKENTWKQLKFTGDTIKPRYLSSFGFSEKDSNIGYLFGGLGNSQGKQILGKEFYYDLYKIDFKNQTTKKLWDYKCDERFQRLPINSLKVSENDSSFYTLMFSLDKRNTHLRAIKGSINEAKLTFIGDTIPYSFYDIESFADLYYWESENKLIALTSHQTEGENREVNIYSISYEPGNIDDFRVSKIGLPLPVKILYFFIGACILILGFVIRNHIRKEKQIPPEKEEYHRKPDIEYLPFSNYEIPKINSVLLFSGFQVFDSKGKEITYRFSPTLKELFLLILLNTLNGGKGISSKRIQEYLWSDKPEYKAKNNRGVNIKKLRDILADISNMEVIFDNNYWKITYPSDVFCDLDFIQKNLQEIKGTENKERLDQIIKILKRGTLLRDIFPEWLDSFKDKTTELIVNSLEDIIKNTENDDSINITLANLIIEFDNMNEAALQLKCRLLSEQGKHSFAIEIYEHYASLYKKLYNEDYKHSFQDIVSKK
jgi:DNA-binding SARP family transcriptional activator